MKYPLFEEKQNIYHLYHHFFSEVLKKYSLAQMDMDILLFLANNPEYDTAAALVKVRHLTKSHVSTSVEKLVKSGYLERFYLPGNKKTIHLRLLPGAEDAVEAGRRCQKRFFAQLLKGMDQEEKEQLQSLLEKVRKNIEAAYQQIEGEED